ncbi:hypothetical protein EYF80_054293 [Liparis tanakae]|uniref:Uncharacterized protein n=1 Tax=Liparis tanakae TaxID=230148 RepID=A0A4Z2F2T1_9TELE|nr:hypothetical protein EYF80_054293 [Liparis tanakae]
MEERLFEASAPSHAARAPPPRAPDSDSRQFSSSDPSLQSVSPSQYQCSAMQLPSVQRNSLSEHLRMSVTARDAEIRTQSLSPSQCHRLRMQ